MSARQTRTPCTSNRLFYCLSIVVALGIYWLKAFSNVNSLDYIAINGTFQNFNGIRRLLAGQLPFEDFTAYLGLGHLSVTSLFTWLFGGDFAASRLAYDFVSSFLVIAFCYGLCALVFRKNWVIPFLLTMYHSYMTQYGTASLRIHFETALKGGNSARAIRGLILPLVVIGYVAIVNTKRFQAIQNETKRLLFHTGCLSVCSGAAVLWSNDYGLMTWFCSWVMLIAVLCIRFRRLRVWLSAVGVMLAGNLLTVGLLAIIVTGGHPLRCITENFLSAGYQSWYYNLPEEHTFFLYQVDVSLPAILCAVGFFYYAVRLIRAKASAESIRRYGVFAFVLLTCLGATNEYKLFGGGNRGLHEVLSLAVVLLAEIEGVALLMRRYPKVKRQLSEKLQAAMPRLGYGAFALVTGSALALPVIACCAPAAGQMVPELGGTLSQCYESLERSRELVGDRAIFSTYASALEVVTNQFQPSGTDYIIHCMTDKKRSDYLQTFATGKYPCVSTIAEGYLQYGPWIRNANWFFYREVYANYHRIGSNLYADYWEAGCAPQTICTDNITVEWEQESDNSYLLTVHAPEAGNGIADVFVSYAAQKKAGLGSLLMYNSVVGVEECNPPYPNAICAWALRPQSAEYVPVDLVDGSGAVRIRSYPENQTTLTLDTASCSRVFITE